MSYDIGLTNRITICWLAIDVKCTKLCITGTFVRYTQDRTASNTHIEDHSLEHQNLTNPRPYKCVETIGQFNCTVRNPTSGPAHFELSS